MPAVETGQAEARRRSHDVREREGATQRNTELCDHDALAVNLSEATVYTSQTVAVLVRGISTELLTAQAGLTLPSA